MSESVERFSRLSQLRGEEMRTPDEVAAMLHLVALGWGERRIARQFGCSRQTVRRYLAAGGYVSYRAPRRVKKLAGLEEWLAERFRRHRGNADVVRQDLEGEKGLKVSLRTIERAVAPLRQALMAEARATLRFETPPGHQLQIDFGETWATVGGERLRLYLFVATLGYSRRLFVRAFRHERQSVWFDGIEAAFGHFGGVPQEVLLDNARALVDRHDAVTREVAFNPRLGAFAGYWGFRPRACAPYRARTKGKDERGVGYVKHNAIAGHEFASWSELEAHLAWWMREVADTRVHGTTGEAPIERDTNAYSVPWRLIGETVEVVVAGGRVGIRHHGDEVASHGETTGRRQRVIAAGHLAGIIRRPPLVTSEPPTALEPAATIEPELLRPLSEYEQAAGGGW